MAQEPLKEIWVESLRPSTLDDVIGNSKIINTLKTHIANKNAQNYLFSGPPGTGKTTVALCLANAQKLGFLELNASDERKIEVVRGKIKDVAMQSNPKLILLDEMEALTFDAQNALRRTIEKFSKTTRFVMTCNRPYKIIDAILSRMTCFHFSPLKNDDMNVLIERIVKEKSLSVPPDVRSILFQYSKGDCRKIINALQSASMISPVITKENIQIYTQVPDIETIRIILDLAYKGDFLSARAMMIDHYVNNGFDNDLICETLLEAVGERTFVEDKNKNNRIIATINAIIANHCHYMNFSSPIVEFSGILAKISIIDAIKSVEQVL